MVVPSCAVTAMVTALFPTFNGMDAEAMPLANDTPFTLIVALASLRVGVTEMDEIVLLTDAV